LVLFTDLLRVQQVECTHSGGECQQRHREILEHYQGRLVLFLKPAEITAKLREDPSLRAATVEVKFPNKITALLESETRLLNLGFILIDNQYLSTPPESSTSANPLWREIDALKLPVSNWYELNQQGELLPGTEAEKRVLVLGTAQPAKERLAQLYQLFFLAERNGIGISQLWLRGDHAGLTSTLGVTAFLDLNTDLADSLASLQQILSATTIDFTTTVVDLRFSNPVIVKQGENY
jgi:hypothetical protein